jgi:hypothetical protein
MSTAFKVVYRGGFTPTPPLWVATDLGSAEEVNNMHKRCNWNNNLVCTVGEEITTNDYTVIILGGGSPTTVPLGFTARRSLQYLARWVLARDALKIVELSYNDPDDLANDAPGDDYLFLLRADVVAELTRDDLEAAA